MSIATTDFHRMKYGFFVHYVWAAPEFSLTKDSQGKVPKSLNELADGFDVARFTGDLKAWAVEYIIFTAWHAGINPLFPSETMKQWGLDSHFCRRDLIGEVLQACHEAGIKVMLYTHPRDGHDLLHDDQIKTGWGPCKGQTDPDWSKFDYEKWNNFNDDLYAELVTRYGDKIIGLYLDEGSVAGDSFRVVDYPRLRQTIKGRHPHLVMIQNWYGTLYSCDIGDKEYHHWQEFTSRDGKDWPGHRMPVGSCFADTWYAEKPAGVNTVKFSAEDMFQYTVLQIGINTEGGGVQWATGPYMGGGWETGVDETMRKLADYIRPIETSLKNVYASRVFPTRHEMTLKTATWGIATDAADGSATYLHILKPPGDKTVRIGMPYDGSRFSQAELLTSFAKVDLHFDAAGYLITLPSELPWDPLDTVIRLTPITRPA